jgi:hypothetical protein
MAAAGGGTAAAATSPPTLDLKVLLIGDGSSDTTTAAWESALSNEGVPYTLVTASGTAPSETVTLPTLSSGTTGYYNGVVIADDPADFASGQLSALDTYESTFGVRQVDGYAYPTSVLGLTEATGGALDGTTGSLTTAGLAAFSELAGPVPFDTGTYGYAATVNSGAPFTPFITNSAGDVLAGVYQHPSTDPQADVSEMELSFDYNATQLQWLVLAPGLVNWVTQSTHLGLDRKYVEMDIDDTFTPDNGWSTAVHDNDYSDADSLRMDPTDVITAADWSNPTQENTASARPAGEPSTPFRMDQLFNYGGTVEYQNNELDLPGETEGPDPLLAQFQASDPATGKPYSDDFGWLSHTYDTPYLDVGCATQDYIEAELNQNTNDVTAAPDAALPGADESGAAGTGGLGLTKSTIPAGSIDVSNAYGTYDPQVFVPGNHSGFADLAPGTPATVDPPDLDSADASTTGGSLAAGTYEYAVTDQFNAADSPSTDQSQAYVTDGEQGDLAPVVVTGADGSVALTWQAICHAANYIVYRAAAPYTSWTEIGTYATPDSATLPDNSSGDTSPAQPNTVCVGPADDSTSCAGQQELTFTDTGSDTSTPPAGVTYVDTPMPAGWTPPVVEDANESPWEQNPYFSAALTAVGITTVGADASKPYPDPANDQFGIGATYSGPTYAAGQAFVDGTSEVAPRHPINVFYNAATNAQELDEYNTLYTSVAPDSQCHDTSTTTCATTLYTFPQVIDQVVSGMMQNMLSDNPEVSYVHQTNLMGTPPYSSILPPANYVPSATAQSGTDGDGTLYEVLNPLIAEYDSYFNTTTTPYEQLTLGGIGNTLADQTAWSSVLAASSPTVTASETGGVVTIANTGTSATSVPVTVPPGTTVSGSSSLQSYGGDLSGWQSVAGSSSQTLTENVSPSIDSSNSATAIVGTAFSFTVGTTGAPTPAITESGALPSGITFTNNGNGTATIAGTAAAGTGGSYPLTLTATNSAGSATQAFTLTVAQAPAITSPATASFSTGVAGTYTVTTTGYPAPTITETGTLPSGLTFTNNGNGTGTISGTAASGTAGTYPVTLSATNASGSTATLSLTITVTTAAAPAITSGSTGDFTLNQAGAVAVTTTGSPTSAITETGALPAGLTFTDNGNGTALLSGTPTATGTTVITITAANGVSPNATQSFTIVVGQAPAFTSADTYNATLGSASSFTVTTSGYPAPSFGWSNVPPGMTFTDNGNGTATLSGTPTTAGTYAMALSAVNSYGSVQQTLTVTVQQAPAITSGSSTTFTTGTAGSFSVTTTGSPAATVTESGALPSGVTFVNNGNGTATLSGTPASGTNGSYPITITAANGVGSNATQSFTLTVNVPSVAPLITSAGSTTFTTGTAGSFSVTTTGSPAATVTESGALPSGVTFTGNSNGTATLSGTPAAGSQGTYTLTITAKNSAGTATQTFTLTVNAALAITSANSATATAGKAFSFTVTATGTPTPTLSHAGTLPSGVTFTANSNGTATLSGTPAATAQGAYPLTFTATNSTGTVSQSFTLTVDQIPAFTSSALLTETSGAAFSFTVTTTGYPAATLKAGTLPTGVSFSDNGNGTGKLSGTVSVLLGTYSIPITATNSAGTATQTITLLVTPLALKLILPTFTSAATASATAGKPFSFTATTEESKSSTNTTGITHSGTLPAGVTFTNNGKGTATISGTPTSASGGTYPITLTAKNSAGTVTQSFVMTVRAAPALTTAASATATVGSPFNFSVKANGAPAPAITEAGGLPQGLTWVDHGNGTATLAGTPGVDQGGVYHLELYATSSMGTTTQKFTLIVEQKPSITSKASATATHGKAFTFTFTSAGYPVASVTQTGSVKGLTWVAHGNGKATLSGTPTTAGAYHLTITAKNLVGSVKQAFTLTVK